MTLVNEISRPLWIGGLAWFSLIIVMMITIIGYRYKVSSFEANIRMSVTNSGELQVY
jgi:Ca2+-dependent lipid-binding protein